MKSVFISIMTIAMVTTIIGGGIYASFYDIEASSQNDFTAGTLNLSLTDASDDGTESETATWVFDAIFPGDSGGGARLTISNTGSIDGYLDLSNITVTNAENYDANTDEAEATDDADTSDATGGGEMGANLLVQIWIDANNDGTVDVDGSSNLLEESIYPAAAIGQANPGVTGVLDSIAASYDLDELLNNGGSTYIALLYDLPSSTDNGVQGDSATLAFTVELDQSAD
jgi:predicted ribosomally synthesized peptide with SipW-like signal peptide